MDLGKELRRFVVEPLTNPVPQPEPTPEPVKEPEPVEPEHAPT